MCFSSAVPHPFSPPRYITRISSFLHPACYCLLPLCYPVNPFSENERSASDGHIWYAFLAIRPVEEHDVPPCPPRAPATCVCNLPLPEFGRHWHSPCGVCLGKTPCAQACPSAELRLKSPKRWADYLRVGLQLCQELNPGKQLSALLFTVCVSYELICSTSKYCDINRGDDYSHSKARQLNMSLYLWAAAECSVHV